MNSRFPARDKGASDPCAEEEATVTNLADDRVIVLADHALAQRKRARRFWSSMAVVLRFDEHRTARGDGAVRSAAGARASRRDMYAPRSR
jgi:hypothetical protein